MNSCAKGTGWEAPNPNAIPLAGEDIDKVLKRFARLPQVASALQLGTRVLAVTRHAVRGEDVTELKVRAAIDSIGTGNYRKPVGASGMPTIGEAESADRIAYGIPDLLGTARDR